MESPTAHTRTFVFVDVNPKHSNPKHITQVVKSQARAYSHQQRIKREGGATGAVAVVQKRQRRLLKPQHAQAAAVQAAQHAAAKKAATVRHAGTSPETTDNAQHIQSDLHQPSLLSILGGGRVDPFTSISLSTKNLSLRKYLDHWITVVAPVVCGLAPGETKQPSMKTVWIPITYGDPTLLAATMFASVSHLNLMDSEPGPEYFILKGKTLELIKRNLEDPERAISDSNIAAVLILARFGNHLRGGPIQNDPHKQVLKRMIDLRGGIQNLGFDGILAKLIMLCDLLSVAFEGTTSSFFPNEPFAPKLHSPFSPLRKFASSSPLLDCGDMEKIESSPIHGKEISAVVQELQESTTIFRNSGAGFPELGDENSNASRNKCLEFLIGVPFSTLLQTNSKSDKYVIGACFLAGRIYRRAVVYGVPFADEINREPMMILKSLLERIGIEKTWTRIPGVLVWILLTGGAAAEGMPEKDYFVALMVRIGMGIGLQNWDEFRTTCLNFAAVERELMRRDFRDSRVISLVEDDYHEYGRW